MASSISLGMEGPWERLGLCVKNYASVNGQTVVVILFYFIADLPNFLHFYVI